MLTKVVRPGGPRKEGEVGLGGEVMGGKEGKGRGWMCVLAEIGHPFEPRGYNLIGLSYMKEGLVRELEKVAKRG